MRTLLFVQYRLIEIHGRKVRAQNDAGVQFTSAFNRRLIAWAKQQLSLNWTTTNGIQTIITVTVKKCDQLAPRLATCVVFVSDSASVLFSG